MNDQLYLHVWTYTVGPTFALWGSTLYLVSGCEEMGAQYRWGRE